MIGSLGLFRQLAALGRAAPKGSAADLNKRVARLSEDAKLRFKTLRAEEKAKIDAARAAAQTAFDRFLAENGLPPRPDYRKERAVVAAFVRNESASDAGLSTDGYSLKVNGREVASRSAARSRFMKVCPGKFGEDKTSRRAANAILDVLGSGLRIDDRDATAFIRPRSGGGGRVVSPEACYEVEVSARIRRAAAMASGEVFGPSQFFAPAEEGGGQIFETAERTSRDFDGLGRSPRRRRRKSRR